MNRIIALAGLLIGGFAVILQFCLTISARMDAGHNLPEAILLFFSFFTILTNIAAVLAYIAFLFPDRFAAFATPRARATVAVSIALVGLVYAAVLAQIWAPEGLFWLCDVLLHYVAPIVFVSWWALFARTGTLNWRDGPRMLIFPLAYLGYALIRGQLMGIYPYPFIDVATLGVPTVAFNVLCVAAVFILFSFIAIAFDRAVKPSSSLTRLP